ncbi:hypothetical protein NPIL_702961 [Nephila pilipes]|uniref:Uncharacterized protein n=1 Tax=Nephila pilipes TaxID=299642 RepID=A0A8X6N0S4_NEPPI|nr:hypothetical protein NPIL_702961 [Nephila pilipes]
MKKELGLGFSFGDFLILSFGEKMTELNPVCEFILSDCWKTDPIQEEERSADRESLQRRLQLAALLPLYIVSTAFLAQWASNFDQIGLEHGH